jgi:hypothetical protein
MTKIEGSGSICQRHGSADPDPPQNVMDPHSATLPDPLARGMDPRIGTRIHTKILWIRSTDYKFTCRIRSFRNLDQGMPDIRFESDQRLIVCYFNSEI